MRLSIICDDNMVAIDGVAANIDLSQFGIDPDVHAIQWHDVTGEVEYRDRRPNKVIEDISGYAEIINAHAVASAPEIAVVYTLDELKEKRVAEVKGVAQAKINAVFPEWKQRNLIARSTELLDKKIDAMITAGEEAELAGIKAVWNDTIKAIRSASDIIEAEIIALATEAEVSGYDVETNPNWP